MRPVCLPRPPSRAVRVWSTRQHAVFGGDPALALAAQEGGGRLSSTLAVQHPGVAHFDQHRTFGMAGEVAGQADGTQLVGLAFAGAHAHCPGFLGLNFSMVERISSIAFRFPLRRDREGARDRGRIPPCAWPPRWHGLGRMIRCLAPRHRHLPSARRPPKDCRRAPPLTFGPGQQHRHGMHQVGALEGGGHLLAADFAPQPVATEQRDVAMIERRLAREFDFRRRRAAPGNQILLRSGCGRLRFGKHSFLDQKRTRE